MKDEMLNAARILSRPAPPALTSNGRFSQKFKNYLCAKHAFKCQYCGGHVGTASSCHLDHIHPASRGGEDVESNLRLSCASCNAIKRDFDIEHLRWCLRVKRSRVAGIILPKQARQLEEVGIDLQLGPEVIFAYEASTADGTTAGA